MKIPYSRRFLAGFLVFCLTFSMFPVVSAEENAQPCGVCGAAEGHVETCEFYGLPAETKPEETEPEETKPEETEPKETKPEETKPEETESKETKPEETEPKETKPAATVAEVEVTAYEKLLSGATLAEIDAILKEKDNRAEVAQFKLAQWRAIGQKVTNLYNALETPTDEETALKDALTAQIDGQIARFCTHCGKADGAHAEDCASLCTCGSTDGVHTEECPLSSENDNATEKPSEDPTEDPTEKPAEDPTEKPSEDPTEKPAEDPTEKPSEDPTEDPTEKPAEDPTEKPAEDPTEKPSEDPTEKPTEKPAEDPTEKPSEDPTEKPSEDPTEKPSEDPTEDPTEKSTEEPTEGSANTLGDKNGNLLSGLFTSSLANDILLNSASPLAAGPTITAAVYTDANCTADSFVANLTESGIILNGWDYRDARYVQISYSGLDPAVETTITVSLDEILYFDPVPSDATFVQNEKLPVNPSGTYLNENSGTATFKLTNSTEGTFAFCIKYDSVLWKRQANQYLRRDTTKPILGITLDSGDVQAALNITDAVSSAAYYYNETSNGSVRNNIKFYKNSASDSNFLGYDKDVGKVAALMEETILLELRAYAGASTTYRFYSDRMTVKIQLPSCTINGNTYYMQLDKDNMLVPMRKNGSYMNYSHTLNEDTGELTITFDNILPDSYILGRVYLKFPTIPNLPKGKYNMVGELRMYNGDVEMHQSSNETQFTIVLDNDAAADLVAYPIPRSVGSTPVTDETVNYLGGYSLANLGNKASDPVSVKMTFNNNGKALIGVTSITLMPDPNQRPMTVWYTLMDENGTVIDDNGKPFAITVSHNITEYTSNRGVLFSRNALPSGHRQYYFKTVEYSIGYVPGTFTYNVQEGTPMDKDQPGNFYGYYLGEAASATATTLGQILNADGTEIAGLTTTVNTKFAETSDVPIYINKCTFEQTEVTAGEAWNMSIRAIVDEYPYGTQTMVDQIRFGILLPDTAVINESSVSAKFADANTTATVKSISQKSVGNGQTFWIIEMAGGQPMGWYTENLQSYKNGFRITLDLQVTTSTSSLEETLYMGNRLFVVGSGIVNLKRFATQDIYDLNSNGSTSDYVGSTSVPNESITIRSRNALLEDSAELSTSSSTGTTEDIYSAEEIVSYNISIENNKGGIAKDLAYYIQIPQESLGGTSDKLVLAGAGTTSHREGTKIKLLYTTNAGLTYDNVAGMDESDSILWQETVADYSKVTMVKAIAADVGGLINGTDTGVSLPLKYSGTDFAKCAGSSVTISNLAVYTYVQGIKSISYEIPSADCRITLNHISAEKEFTLTAALEMNPTDPNVRADTYDTGLSFYNAQEFKITNLVMNNVDLGNYTTDELKADANKRFKVDLQMNAGTAQAVVKDLPVGTLAAGNALSFNFELFNGDALTDVTTERYITFDIASDSVTIPVRININRELATAAPTVSAIKAGKEYVNAGESKEVTISQNSAFTVQFVTNDLSDALYGARTLQFSTALPIGTTIAMLDYTGSPRYAHYEVTSSVQNIDLTAFKIMGSGTAYTRNTGTDIDETLLFVVDFSGASSYLSGTHTVQMFIDGTSVDDKLSDAMNFTANGVRSFSSVVDDSDLTYGESFQYTYTVGGASNDSKYDGRDLMLIVSGENLPSDAYLLVDGNVKRQNAHQQFVIDLGNAQSAGTKTLRMQLVSDSLENNLQDCTITAQMWISGLAGTDPHGRVKEDAALNVTYKAVTPPSLKITDMSDRALAKDELANTVTLSYSTKDIPTGATVTLEIQKMVDAGYVTDATYLESLTSSDGGSAGVYTVSSSGGTLTLKFSQTALTVGNYQVLMSVQNGDAALLEVPYRFVVTD